MFAMNKSLVFDAVEACARACDEAKPPPVNFRGQLIKYNRVNLWGRVLVFRQQKLTLPFTLKG